jgi:acyl carrier protein
MHRDDIISMTNEVFEQEFELEREQLLPDANIFSELGLDSLDTVDLIVALQKKFGVAIRGDERVRDIRTLNDLYDFIADIGISDAKGS